MISIVPTGRADLAARGGGASERRRAPGARAPPLPRCAAGPRRAGPGARGGAAPPPAAAPPFPTTAARARPRALADAPRAGAPHAPERAAGALRARTADLPVVHATLVTRGGTRRRPAELPGLAAFTADMLDEGAGGLSALQLSDALDAARRQPHHRRGLGRGAGRPARAARPPPRGARPPGRRGRPPRLPRRRGGSACGTSGSPTCAAPPTSRAPSPPTPSPPWSSATATPTGGSRPPRASGRWTGTALRRFHAAYYRPAGSTLILVGDVDPAALHPSWSAPSARGAAAPRPPRAAPAAPRERPTTASTWSTSRAPRSRRSASATRGVARDNPDYFPLVVLNTSWAAPSPAG